MNDSKTTIDDLKRAIKRYADERDWGQFHTPKSLSMNIAVEAAELMELFLWVDSADAQNEIVEKNRSAVEDEVADVAHAVINFCVRNNIDLCAAIEKKMVKNALKYPIEKCKGKREKYTLLN
jgi:dCTP diphosphatase